ncbi:MAG: ABC transporter ATP-binding protein [Chloroflexi bacterium]|nr:ABC transporter ATP-binding protein [Chloroflexota bacterium]
MSDIAIRVENLSKRYHIGQLHQRHDTLRDALVDALTGWRDRRRKTEDGIPRPRSSVPGPSNAIWALKDVSFEVKRGEVVGIIGRNGAGKSTLLKILSRITEPTSGQAIIHGRVGSLLEVGTGFHPELTGRENIYLNGAILGMRKREIDKKFDEIVAFAEIEKFIDTPVKRYSSGMYVRLAFAVAAHLEPEILLVDEVLAVGDAAFQKKCLGKMGDVAREGRTVLFVSHNMGAIQRLCSHSVWLDQGEIAALNDSAEVIAEYLNCTKSRSQHINLIEASREGDLGNQARISRCIIYDISGKPRSVFAFGEPIKIEIECKVLKQIEDLSLLVGIDNIYGDRIITITSMEANVNISASIGEIIRGCLTINDLLLRPGEYAITVGAFSGSAGIDRYENAAFFEVGEMPYDRSVPLFNQKWGVIQLLHPLWELSKEVGG